MFIIDMGQYLCWCKHKNLMDYRYLFSANVCFNFFSPVLRLVLAISQLSGVIFIRWVNCGQLLSISDFYSVGHSLRFARFMLMR